MILKNEYKIRKLLDYKKYHLCTDSHGEWKLFGNKDTSFYFSKFNEPIMTSKTHTEEDLLKFAKEHHKYDESLSLFNFRVIFAYLTVVLCIINFKLNSPYLSGMIWGINLIIIVEGIFQHIISNHNFKITMKEFEERRKNFKVDGSQIEKNPLD